jgi:hypothetical protein
VEVQVAVEVIALQDPRIQQRVQVLQVKEIQVV